MCYTNLVVLRVKSFFKLCFLFFFKSAVYFKYFYISLPFFLIESPTVPVFNHGD